MVKALGFRVWGLGFKDVVSGLRIRGFGVSGFRVSGLGFRDVVSGNV